MRPFAATCAALLAAALPVVAAADAPRAAGRWIVDGKKTELNHVRGFREPDPFGRGTHPCALLSNEPVPDTAVPDDEEGISELLDRMRSGPLRALQVCFQEAGTSLRNVNDVFTFHPGVSPGRFGFQGFHQFAARREPGRIAGRLTGSGTTPDDRPWSVDVELSLPLPAE